MITEHIDFVYQRILRDSGVHAMNKATLDIFKQFKPDIVINSLSWWKENISPQTLSLMRKSGAKVISIYWDTWINALPHETEILLSSDHILIMDSLSNYLKYRYISEQQKNVNKVIFCPIAVFTDVIKPLDKEKDIDVLVLGSSEGSRSELISYLERNLSNQKMNFQHMGGLVNDKLPQKNNSKNWINWDMYVEMINRSKICISSQTQPDRRQIKGKVFDFLACNSFCLTDDNLELKNFIPNSCIAYYTDKEDCLSQILHYLKNDESRSRISKNGHEWFNKNYDYRKFWKNLLNVVKERETKLFQLPGVENVYKTFLQKQNLIIRNQSSAINQLAQLITSEKTIERLTVHAEGSYKGMNILNVDNRHIIVCDHLDYDFINIDDSLFAICPEQGIIKLEQEQICASSQFRLVQVTTVEQAKKTIDILSK